MVAKWIDQSCSPNPLSLLGSLEFEGLDRLKQASVDSYKIARF
jgi:hypothetical protein